jgi:hypothetical protein
MLLKNINLLTKWIIVVVCEGRLKVTLRIFMLEIPTNRMIEEILN